MPAILEVDGLTKFIGELELFSDISFAIEEGNKVGLIARNGIGKTTLLNILADDESYDAGEFTIRSNARVGYLSQEPVLDDSKTVIEAVFHTSNETLNLFKDYKLAVSENRTNDIERLTELIDNKKIWDYENRIEQLLSQLGINNLKQKVSELSGGQRKRLALASILIEEPDLVILDEPTNHLDVASISWLENYLSKAKVSLLMVTHDRYFLDRVCNEILELDRNSMFRYKGNYSYFLQKREERWNQLVQEKEKAENLLRKEQEWMRRMPKARGTKAKYRINNFHHLKEKASVSLNESKVKINVSAERLGKKIMEARNVNFFWGEDCYLNDFTYTFSRFDKIGVLGENGIGKSTFLDLLTGKLQPKTGSIVTGETIKYGYYTQKGLDFDEKMKVLDAVTEIAETIKLGDGNIITASQFLNHFLFPPARQHDYIYKLSGGEKRRLYLCSVLMQNPNFLILDEPTNDLDIDTLEILEDYLQYFAGCVMVVSHDRYFLDQIVEHTFIFKGQGNIKDFPGNYSQYIDWQKEQDKSREQVKKKLVDEKKPPVKTKLKFSYKEKLELEELEKILPQLEEEKQQLEGQLNSGNLSAEELQKFSVNISDLIEEIDTKTFRWMELEDKKNQ